MDDGDDEDDDWNLQLIFKVKPPSWLEFKIEETRDAEIG